MNGSLALALLGGVLLGLALGGVAAWLVLRSRLELGAARDEASAWPGRAADLAQAQTQAAEARAEAANARGEMANARAEVARSHRPG